MANRYWVGGDGNWSDDDNHWATVSNGSPSDGNLPTFADSAIVDEYSGTTSNSITLDVEANCLDLILSDSGPRIAGEAPLYGGTINIYGSLIGGKNMTQQFNGTVYFKSTSTGKTVSFGSYQSMSLNIVFDGIGGGWTFNDGASFGFLSSVTTLTLTNGSLNINGENLQLKNIVSNNSNVRTLSLGDAEITLKGTGTVLDFEDSTNLTFNAGTSLFITTNESGSVIKPGGKTFYNISFIQNAQIIGGNGTYNSITFAPAKSYVLGAGYLQTISNLLAEGTSGNLITFNSDSAGTMWKISSGTTSVRYCSVKDSWAQGGAAPFDNTNGGVDRGNNIGWNFRKMPFPISRRV